MQLDPNDKINDLRALEVRFLIYNKTKIANGNFTSVFKIGLGWGMTVTNEAREKLLAYEGLTFQASES